jgi:hypothetical protein
VHRAATVLWAAGVRAEARGRTLGVELGPGCRIPVGPEDPFGLQTKAQREAEIEAYRKKIKAQNDDVRYLWT